MQVPVLQSINYWVFGTEKKPVTFWLVTLKHTTEEKVILNVL